MITIAKILTNMTTQLSTLISPSQIVYYYNFIVTHV